MTLFQMSIRNTEELILQDLRKNTEQLTTIIISHRISTIKDSDMIIVMDEGRINEIGSHDAPYEKMRHLSENCTTDSSLLRNLKEEV